MPIGEDPAAFPHGVDRIPALLGARHSAVPPIELRLAAVDEAEAVGKTNRIGSVYFTDRSHNGRSSNDNRIDAQ